MIRRPPRSTLFPYPTLSGSHRAQPQRDAGCPPRRPASAWRVLHGAAGADQLPRDGLGHARVETRSEEHTSELQSRQYLVCRLLLEKKKTYHVQYFHAYHMLV